MNQEQLEEMFEKNGGDLSDEQMAALLSGEELDLGDTNAGLPNSDQEEVVAKEETGATKEPDVAKADGEAASEKEKVVVAKDGVHTIPYDKLVEARDAAKASKEEAESWRSIAEERDRLIEELKAKSTVDATAKEEAATEDAVNLLDTLEELGEDYPEAAKGIKALLESNKTLAEKVEALGKIVENTTAAVSETTAKTAAEKHFETIRSAHADYADVVVSPEFNSWVEAQPKFLQAAYKEVLESGTATDVIEMLDSFKPTVAADDKADKVASSKDKLVEERIRAAEAKSTTPSSLSDIPSGSQVTHDEGERLRESSAIDLMDVFSGKSQEQIEALLQRTL